MYVHDERDDLFTNDERKFPRLFVIQKKKTSTKKGVNRVATFQRFYHAPGEWQSCVRRSQGGSSYYFVLILLFVLFA